MAEAHEAIQQILNNGNGATKPNNILNGNKDLITPDTKIGSLFNQRNPEAKNYFNPDDEKNINAINLDFTTSAKARAKGLLKGGAVTMASPAFLASSLLCFFFFTFLKASQLAITSNTDIDKAVDYAGQWFLNNSKNILGMSFDKAAESLSGFILAKEPEHHLHKKESSYEYEATGDGKSAPAEKSGTLDDASQAFLTDLEIQAKEQSASLGR
jgi:hypothetical protein